MRQKEGLIEGLQEQKAKLTERDTTLSGQVAGLQQQLAASSAEVTRVTADINTAVESHAQAVQVRLRQLVTALQSVKGCECLLSLSGMPAVCPFVPSC